MIWTTEANPVNAIDNFAVAVEADIPTKGSWREDFNFYCEKYKIIQCPMINVSNISADKESCRVINSVIDAPNWKAMLLACCTVGSKVVEISVHGSRIDGTHIQDLAVALKKMGTCQCVKLQYLDFQDVNESSFQEGLVALLNDGCGLDALSLKGNNFSDEQLATTLAALSQNFKLSTLILSNNRLSDASLQVLAKATRCVTSLKYVVMSGNQVTGTGLQSLADVLLPGEMTPEDDATIKGNAKALGDKNKATKELNKKRKKGGQVELKELTAPLEVTVKKEKTMLLVNRSFKQLDLSDNKSLQAEHVKSFVQRLADAPAGLPLSAAAQPDPEAKLVLVLTGSGITNGVSSESKTENDIINTDPQPWITLQL